MKQTILVT